MVLNILHLILFLFLYSFWKEKELLEKRKVILFFNLIKIVLNKDYLKKLSGCLTRWGIYRDFCEWIIFINICYLWRIHIKSYDTMNYSQLCNSRVLYSPNITIRFLIINIVFNGTEIFIYITLEDKSRVNVPRRGGRSNHFL
jgi:hypothetical protein